MFTYIAQSPTFQSVIPDRFVLPAVETIQNCPLTGDAEGGLPVLASQVPSKARLPATPFIWPCNFANAASIVSDAAIAVDVGVGKLKRV